jgi:hypothetical protein
MSVPASGARACPLPVFGPVRIVASLLARGTRASARAPQDLYRFEIEPIDIVELARYCRLLGFPDNGEVPLTYSYLHAFRAHLAVMLSRDFPFSPVGILHVENHLIGLRAYQPQDEGEVEMEIRLEPPTPSGAIFIAIDTSISQGDCIVVMCQSRYLAQRGGPAARTRERRQVEELPSFEIESSWKLDASSGWRYARASGDYNPVHLLRLSARVAGLRSRIIQGMESVGRAAASLQQASGRPVTMISSGFRRPIAIPATVRMIAAGNRYQVWSAGELAISGAFSHMTS